MKWNLKPWQIGLIAAAGVVVLGGAGVGIYFGVNHAIDNTVDEKPNATLESMTGTTTEPALDEPATEIPSQVTGEPDTTTAQPTKEPETVLVPVAPTETNKPDAPAAPEPQPEPEPEIELVYDEQLTKEVAELMTQKFTKEFGYFPYQNDDLDEDWCNYFTDLIYNKQYPINTDNGLLIECPTLTAEYIVSRWTAALPGVRLIRVYKSNNLICVICC